MYGHSIEANADILNGFQLLVLCWLFYILIIIQHYNLSCAKLIPHYITQPNIIKVVDSFQSDTMIYIVMEWLRGGDLFDRIMERER